MKLQQLDHFGIEVRALARAERFYTEVLGLDVEDGRIVAVGASVDAPSDAIVVDGTGKFVTPGIIDPHSHIGGYAGPRHEAATDGNETRVHFVVHAGL